jgi:hypothetical protein
MSNLVDDVTPQLGGNLDGQDKVLSAVTLKDYSESWVNASVSSGILTINVQDGNVQFHAMSQNISQIDFINVLPGEITTITIFFFQHASAPKTVDFTNLEMNSVSATDYWAQGVPATISSGTDQRDIISFIVDADQPAIYGLIGGQNFSE